MPLTASFRPWSYNDSYGRQRIFRSQILRCPRKTQRVLFVMTLKARIVMLLYFVTGVIWLYTKVSFRRSVWCTLVNIDIRLLWCTIHPRRTVALSEMHRLSRNSCSKFLTRPLFNSLTFFISNVFSALTKEARSSKPCTVNGYIYYVPSGFPKRAWQTKSLWNPSQE